MYNISLVNMKKHKLNKYIFLIKKHQINKNMIKNETKKEEITCVNYIKTPIMINPFANNTKLNTPLKPTLLNPIPFSPLNGSSILSLYNIPTVLPNSGSNICSIAIIIAFSYPYLKQDLNTYWQSEYNFGPKSTPPNVNVYTMPGATYNLDWALEECLDVQTVCTINPKANIVVVEAKSDTQADLLYALNYATNTLKVNIVSCSWGAIDNLSISSASSNAYFTNNSVCYCAASGDSNVANWPAILPNCVAVGGNTIYNKSNLGTWVDSGCGYSSTQSMPLYQSNNINKSLYTASKRIIPDVALMANPNTGINIYCTMQGGWTTVGGTSLATPIFASMLSIANQQRFNIGKSSLTTVTSILNNSNNVQNCLYKTISNPILYANIFNDITKGSDKGSSTSSSTILTTYNAINGFDLCTGLGSPNCLNMCNLLSSI
jgi:subtilase family serine protease